MLADLLSRVWQVAPVSRVWTYVRHAPPSSRVWT